MILYLHDNTPSAPGEKHGSRGPTHFATIRDIDYEYQVELWISQIAVDHPNAVRIECPELRCEWRREGTDMIKETVKC